MIVIVATANDVTMEAVVQSLHRLGRRDLFHLDLERSFDEVSLTFHADSSRVQWTVQSRADPSLCFDESSVSAVYWRRPVSKPGSPLLGIPTSENLDSVELFWSLRWLIEALPERLFPLGHPYTFARGENKHRQLEFARQIGFRIPTTCHSNNLAELDAFLSSRKEIAVKAMSRPAVSNTGEVAEARHISCRSFASDFIRQRLQSVQKTQLFCQDVIKRRRDLRIMVLPHQTIAAEIDTTALQEGKLDWREHSLELIHRIVPIDPAFEQQLRAFLRLMGLSAGYFDFAAPDDGPPVFFECNTNAGWLWIEQVTGYPIAEAIARELAGDHRG